MSFGATPSYSSDKYNPNKHAEVPNTPSDSISSLAWFPSADYMACGSWNNEVRLYEVQKKSAGWGEPQLAAQGKAGYTHNGPVLSVSCNRDGKVFSGSCDKTIKCLQVGGSNMSGGQQSTVIGTHDAPVKTVDCLANGLVMSGSWDKTVRYWDLRQMGKPALVVKVPERVYTSSVLDDVAVLGLAERQILVYDLKNPQNPVKQIESPLRYQTRCVAMFHDKKGFAIGSIEGRVGIQYFQEDQAAGRKNFAFKCHREGNDVFAVNSISFHPQQGTFSTAGADGSFHFWDKDIKQRLQQYKRGDPGIVCGAFNRDGSIFSYAVSYDWSKGPDSYDKNFGSRILMLAPGDVVKARRK